MLFHFINTLPNQSRTEFIHTQKHSHISISNTSACQPSQCPHVVFPINSWDNNFRQTFCGQFSIHHHTRDSSVTIKEWMHFTDEEHHVNSSSKWLLQQGVPFE